MKLSTILLTALSAAVLTACEKSDAQPTPDDDATTTQRPTDILHPGGPQPEDCPGCGMG